MSFTFKPQQEDFFTALTTTSSHLALVARAGCGKTTTILEGVNRYRKVNARAKVLVCAFNRDIKLEVEEKLKLAGHDFKTAKASTVHGLGMGLVLGAMGKIEMKAAKVRLAIRASNDRTCRQYGAQVERLVGVAKQAGVGFFPDQPISSRSTWAKLAAHFSIDNFERTDDLDRVIDQAMLHFQRSLDDQTCMDFNDQILWPLIFNLAVKWPYDLIFVDEAQDLSRARQALVRKFLAAPYGRMVVVGDDRQAIYGFSGADSDALINQVKHFAAVTLPLNITFRCPKAVVRVAQRWVPDITAAEEAPEGEVIYTDELPGDLGFGDAILCRNVAPLVTAAYNLIRAKVPAKVLGRDIGAGLIALAVKFGVEDTEEPAAKLDQWEARETQKEIAKGDDDAAERITERVDTLRHIIAALNKDGLHEVNDVVRFCQDLFGVDGEDQGKIKFHGVVLASYHKSKGQEWNRVILLDHDERCPSKWAKQKHQLAQEDNLQYVAVTRSKNILVFCDLRKEEG